MLDQLAAAAAFSKRVCGVISPPHLAFAEAAIARIGADAAERMYHDAARDIRRMIGHADPVGAAGLALARLVAPPPGSPPAAAIAPTPTPTEDEPAFADHEPPSPIIDPVEAAEAESDASATGDREAGRRRRRGRSAASE